MIIWTGLGFLVLVIAIACPTAAVALATYFTSDPNYYSSHAWVTGSGLMAAGVICWFFGRHLASRSETLIDPTRGQPVVSPRSHTLFFVPMHLCGVLLFLIGLGVSSANTSPEELQRKRAESEVRRILKEQGTTKP